MICAVGLCRFLWIRDLARLLRGTFVSWWYLPRIWPSVTDMQHHYHARYPTDDWHLAYLFSLVYFSVDVCLVGVFPHSVSTRRDPCVRVCAPLTLASPPPPPPPPHKKTNFEHGWPGSPLGPIDLTHGSACVIGWQSGLLDILIPPYIAQFMGCVIGRIHYGLKVVFCFRHFPAYHYHHNSRLFTGIENM